MIEKAPHPVFAVIWAVLTVACIVAGIIGHVWFATIVGLAILIVEANAVVVRRKLRDTWSEITTWVNRHLSKHKHPGRGWNTLVAIQAIALGRLVFIIVVGWGGPELLGYAIGGLLALGQHDHWLNPEENG